MNLLSDPLRRLHDAARHTPLSSTPTCLCKPTEGQRVLFWTHDRLSEAHTRATALSGVYRQGEFWVGPDHWNPNEVECWADTEA